MTCTSRSSRSASIRSCSKASTSSRFVSKGTSSSAETTCSASASPSSLTPKEDEYGEEAFGNKSGEYDSTEEGGKTRRISDECERMTLTGQPTSIDKALQAFMSATSNSLR